MAAPLLLDGRALARDREGPLRARALRVRAGRGRPPRLLLVAFAGPGGDAPFIEGKLRACRACGVEAVPLVLAPGAGTAEVCRRLVEALSREDPDGVFVQFPFPPGVDAHLVTTLVPPEADVDVMGPGSATRYLAGGGGGPPLTAAATLALLDHAGVELEGRAGVVVGDPVPYHDLFREALARRGAAMEPVVSADAAELKEILRRSDLVVVSAARAGWVPSSWCAPQAVVVDAGYFNPGGKGDVDTAPGVDHLSVLVPVPGGVGPMTVSALVEAVVVAAERRPEGRRG